MDQHGQVIAAIVSCRRDIAAAERFFQGSIASHGEPVKVITDKAPALARVIDALIPAAFHKTEQYANIRCEADDGRLKSGSRPMRGLKTDRTARVLMRGHAFVQNVGRGHYGLGVEVSPELCLVAAFSELQQAI